MSANPTFRPPGAQPGGLSRVPYLPGLDGLRAIAVVAVMLFHANHDWMPGGFLGVEVFFVISGYLITLLLIGEQERTGHVDLAQFWFRRFRRLLPALFVMMAAVAVYISIAYTDTRERSRGDFLGGALYISNWYQIWVGQGYSDFDAFVPLRHLWSLAVEEQFYVIWPLVMVAILQRAKGRRLPAVGLKLILASAFIAIMVAVLYAPGSVGSCSTDFRAGTFTFFGHCFSTNDTLYLSSISRSGGLLLGSGFAMLWRPMAIMRGPLRDKGKRLDVLAAGALALLVVFFLTMYLADGGRNNPWLFRGGFFLTGVLTLVLIAAASHQGASAGRLLGNKVFLWIGTRSYGLYLYHWPIYQIIRKKAGLDLSLAQFVLAMLIAVPITEASYRFIETPIRKNGFGATIGRLKRVPMQAVAGGAVALVLLLSAFSLSTADPHCVGDQDCAQEAARATDETTPETLPPDTTVPGSVDPNSTDSTSTSTTVPKEPAKYVAIGESVMIGAQPLLEGSGVLVQAKEGRGPDGVKNAVILLRDNGDIGLGTKIVIQVGTNAPLSQGDLDKIMAEVPTGTSGVAFMTLHAPGISYVADNNTLLKGMTSLYPNVSVIDWDAESANVELCDDGIHISCNGSAPAKYYANLLLASFGLPAIS